MDSDDPEAVEKTFAALDLARARRHVFLCIGPDCCAPEKGQQTWDFLKQALKSRAIPALRTKAACFRICTGGPWMVVYPEGVWYGQVTPERCARIVEQHLDAGRPVAEWVVRRHPLPTESQ